MPLKHSLLPLCVPGMRAGMVVAVACVCGWAAGQAPPPEPPVYPKEESAAADAAIEEKPFYIRHYRITGAKELPRVDVEGAVYPYMGPACTQRHVELAAAALQKAYRDKGFQTVSVTFAPEVKNGAVTLIVTEARIGRLRVKGSRYFSLEKIKAKAPSLAEGKLPNFNDIQRDILSLNRHPDRQITPDIRPGAEPGTFDVDLNVKDKLPLHGSLELNNRYSPDTTQLRVNGSISYGNLWQAGHTLGVSFQIAPERLDDAAVYSAFYSMPVQSIENLSLTFSGTKQDSDISTLGGAAVAGRGYILGLRANYTLPAGKSYYHSLSGGFDFKHFDQDITVGTSVVSTPVDYVPLSLTYSGTHIAPKHSTDLSASLVMGLRGLSSGGGEFDAKRYNADGGFIYLRAEGSHTHDFQSGTQLFAKIQGQVASGPLINSEQFSGGGLGNARGYLESAVQGDNAIMGSLEVRTPSLIPSPVKEGEVRPSRPNEWRFYAFCDAGYLSNYDPLPEQDSSFPLASVGLGSRFRLRDHFNGSIDAAFPLIDQGTTDQGDIVVTFRMWSDF